MYNTITTLQKILLVSCLLISQAAISQAQDLRPLVGRWNAADVADYVGFWKKSQRIGYLDGTGNGDINGVTPARGLSGDIPIAADFIGDDRDELVLYRPSTRELFFFADYTSTTVTYSRTVGDPGSIFIFGDWDGNGKDGFAEYKPASRSIWYFQEYDSPQPFASIVTGNSGDIPIAGDWDGDGDDSYGVYQNTRDLWLFEDYDDATPNQHMTLGNAGDTPIAGDWNGNGSDGVGVFRRASGTTNNYEFWLYDVIDAAPTRSIFITDQSNFTYAVDGGRKMFYTGSVPHTDFEGNIRTTYSPTQSFIPKGIYDPSPADLASVYQGNYNLAFLWPNYYPLDQTTRNALDATNNQLRSILYFTMPGGKPFTGRFTGQGDLPGIGPDAGSTLLYFDSDGTGGPDKQLKVGDSGDFFFSGDWDGDGTDEFADYKPGTRQIVYFQNIANPTALTTITTGNPGDVPIAGNWDGIGGDGYALYRPSSREIWYFQGYTDTVPFAMIVTGDPGDMIIAGDWDGDGADGYAVYKPSLRQFWFFQHYDDTTPFQMQTAGNPGDMPIAGDWNGDGTDGFGVYRTDAYHAHHELWFYDQVSSTATGLTSAIFQNPLLEVPKKYVYGIYADDEPTGRNTTWQDSYNYLTAVYSAYSALSPHVFFHVDIPYVASSSADYNLWWRQFARLGEATAHDDYPVGNQPTGAQNAAQINSISHIATTIENARTETNETVPNWYVSQAFEQLGSGSFQFYKPSAAQHRSMVYTALAHGATGIFTFAYQNSLFPSIEGISPTHNSDLWTAATTINNELDSLKPYLLSPTSTSSYSIYTKASPQYETYPIRTVLKYFNGYYVLIAVNMTRQSLSSIIQLPVSIAPTDGQARRLFEGTSVKVKAGGINDTFEAFGVHVYKFKAPASVLPEGRQAEPETAEKIVAKPEQVDPIKVFPNPSRAGVTFQVYLAEPGVNIQIMDLQGRTIRTISGGVTINEVTTLIWDGHDATLKRTAAGLYYYTLYSNGSLVKRGKLVME